MFEFLRIGKNPDELCDGNSTTILPQTCQLQLSAFFLNDFFGSGEILAYPYTMQYMS